MNETLADRIRSEAAIADRPGQMARLEAIAVEVEELMLADWTALAGQPQKRGHT